MSGLELVTVFIGLKNPLFNSPLTKGGKEGGSNIKAKTLHQIGQVKRRIASKHLRDARSCLFKREVFTEPQEAQQNIIRT